MYGDVWDLRGAYLISELPGKSEERKEGLLWQCILTLVFYSINRLRRRRGARIENHAIFFLRRRVGFVFADQGRLSLCPAGSHHHLSEGFPGSPP